MAEQAVVGFGGRLHIQNDAIIFDGWWHAALRVCPQTFALRDEVPPEDHPFMADIAARLGAAGLAEVPVDATLLTVITLTTLDIGGLDWRVWSIDAATAECDLAFRVSQEALGDGLNRSVNASGLMAAAGGLRRTAGLAPLVLLAVGVSDAALDTLAAALGNCHLEARALGASDPEASIALTPNLVLVDCTSPQGEEFVVRFRAAGPDQLLPIVALSTGLPEGADLTLDPASDPSDWAAHLQNLLP